MAGILDKIKGMFAGAKDKATAEGGGLDTLKDKAGDLKDKVEELVDKAGDKVPDKVEEAVPGDSDGDGK
jgi:X-X-X-Leu-X-X-Gly heptad repeat protein